MGITLSPLFTMDYLSSTLHQGLQYYESTEERRKIYISNFACAIETFFCLAYALTHWALGNYVFALLLSCTAPLITITYFLNKNGYGLWGRSFQVFFFNVMITYFAGITGRFAGLHYYFFLVALSPFFIFGFQHPKHLAISILATLGSWSILEYNLVDTWAFIKLDELSINILHYTSTFIPISLVCIFSYIFIRENTKAEKELRDIAENNLQQYKELQKHHKEQERLLAKLNRSTQQKVALELEKKEIETSARLRTEFLSKITHEIRTPLNTILGMAELLNEETSSTSKGQKIRAIHASSKNLQRVVESIIDFSDLQAKRLSLNLDDFNLQQEFKPLWRELDELCEEKGLDFQLNLDAEIPLLRGDAQRIQQVLAHICHNAVKFTNKGSISVDISAIARNPKCTLLRFMVKDTGIGIPEEKQLKIFESFNQIENDSKRQFGGIGLGLSITKKMVELHGGSLQLNSILGKGTTISLYLSLETKEGYAGNEAIEDTPLENLEVLVVDDYPLNQLVVNQMLENWGVKVTCANNGQEAIDQAHKKKFDLILMDLQMPVVNSYEATQIIKDPENRTQNHETPILALTADAFSDAKQHILELGASDFLTKPLEQETLKRKIQQLVYTKNPVTSQNIA